MALKTSKRRKVSKRTTKPVTHLLETLVLFPELGDRLQHSYTLRFFDSNKLSVILADLSRSRVERDEESQVQSSEDEGGRIVEAH